jgi:hypothetical protein
MDKEGVGLVRVRSIIGYGLLRFVKEGVAKVRVWVSIQSVCVWPRERPIARMARTDFERNPTEALKGRGLPPWTCGSGSRLWKPAD